MYCFTIHKTLNVWPSIKNTFIKSKNFIFTSWETIPITLDDFEFGSEKTKTPDIIDFCSIFKNQSFWFLSYFYLKSLKFLVFLCWSYICMLAYCLEHWIPNLGVPNSKNHWVTPRSIQQFHPSEINQISTRNSSWLSRKK